jgi:catechol 2,3-dioxygenase-like lactoylglutathione lyase family enzyme
LTGPSPLRHADLFHTGIVVDDLASAKKRFGDLLGLTWFEGGAKVRIRTPDAVSVVSTAYALSAEGPHHVELVQSVPGTLYTVAGADQAHHLGYWADDVRAASAALLAWGLPEVASISVGDDDAAPLCAYHRAGHGFYIELVASAMRPVLFRANPKPGPA